MKHFEKIIENLKTDPYFAIKVVDLKTRQNLVCNATGANLEESHGSVENFFESIYADGVQKVQIILKRKNGNNFKAIGAPYNFDMVSNEVTDAPATTPVHNFVPQAPTPPVFAGLNGGLNAAEIYKYMDHPRLERLCQDLTTENKSLLDKVSSLEKINLKNELLEGKTVASTNANAKLLESFGPLLAPVLESFLTPKTVATVAGLGGADFSAIKRELVEIIKNTDDEVVYYYTVLAKNIDASTVADELITLLERQNLIPKSA